MRSQSCLRTVRIALPFSNLADSAGSRAAFWPHLRFAALAVIFALAPAAQRGLLAQQGWGQSPQYQSPQYSAQPYVQANPNYPSYPQGQQPVYPAQQGYGQDQQYAQQAPYDAGRGGGQGGYAPVQEGSQPFAAEQLEQLVAPIALYPDSLVAQVLAASTYPAQVIAADNWVHSLGYVSPDQVAAGANAQTNWDPSVKALTAFPQVLDLMNRDLHWTTDLGNAYYNQPQDVLQTIQVMRQRAEDAGTLQSTPQEAVYSQQGYIQLAPVNPAVVYVPSYNPWDVYGQPVSPYPGFSLIGALESFAGSSPVQYGLGLAMNAFSHTGFGWAGWALNWLTSSVLFHQSPYASQSTSVQRFGGAFGGQGGGYVGRNGGGINRMPNVYPRTEQGFNRLGNGNGQPGFTHPPVRTGQDFGSARGGEMAGRGGFGSNVRPALPGYAYNRPAPILPARPQTYSRAGGYGWGLDGRAPQSFVREASPYSNRGQQAFRAPEATYQRNDFAQRGDAEPRSYAGNRGYAEAFNKQERSGGKNMFGGHGGGSQHFSYKAPKMPKAMKAPKMSGGGGFGGGHHGGGGGLFGHGFGHR